MQKFISKLVLLSIFIFSAVSSYAAELTDLPGYVDIDSLSFLEGRDANIEVSLNGPVLKMLTQLPIENAGAPAEVADILRVVDQILVRIYSTSPDEAMDVINLISAASSNLEEEDWVRIVRVRDSEDASVDIHVKLSPDGENLNGLVIMAVEEITGDSPQVVFVNIAGNFNPAYLSNLGSQFDIDYLGDIELP